jgi:hypothetical protein
MNKHMRNSHGLSGLGCKVYLPVDQSYSCCGLLFIIKPGSIDILKLLDESIRFIGNWNRKPVAPPLSLSCVHLSVKSSLKTIE